MTMKNVPVAIAFGVITIAQFSLGVYMMNLARREGGKARIVALEE